ncbi:arylsulfatase [Nonomuraea soli]|uniref:Arylsulfatase A-like enzyme n=1 Tax=Nonomuraea soli TaxID=1032476 RepID=A0A7W0CGZ0_9ACTN|nr:arylsulfatase [Nonomuraea soli]MBA2890998.1 arylsulfatase A-like enzyme [Nonomuraea soli]
MIVGPSRRTVLSGALAALAVPRVREEGPGRPNIIVVLADDLGWGEVGFQGQQTIRTPTLDRLAAEGVRFEAGYSGAPLCAPSRCALLTGLHAGHGTVRENPEGGQQLSLTDVDLTFAELAQLSGYRTACIGKWGFGPERPGQPSHPNERGFEEFFGYIDHRHAHQYYPAYLWRDGEKIWLGRKSYAPDLLRDEAIGFLRRPSKRPFLLYFSTILPHSPSVVPGDAGPYQDLPFSRANRRHAAQVARLDADVAALVRALRDSGRAGNTILLFTSDNGPHSEKGVTPELIDANGPFRGDKRDLYEGGIRVPMIAWSPRLRPRVVAEPAAFWDVLPTVADLIGAPVPAGTDGRSLRGLLTGGDHEGHDALVWNRPRKVQAIRQGRWKALRFAPGIAGAPPEGRVELYDLADDPGEQNDLSATWPAFTGSLLSLLDRSIGPDPRLPYGLRTLVDGGRLTVTLHNGSSVPWQDVRLSYEPAKGLRVGDPARVTLAPGSSTGAVFLMPGGSGRVWAHFRTGTRKHAFRRGVFVGDLR